jgi:putative oxidoreductase
MKIAMIILRTLMGLLFLLASVPVLLGLMPMAAPPDAPEGLKVVMSGYVASHYFLTLLKATELVCGLAFVSGYYVPLATVIIAPIIINIFFVNLVFTPMVLPVAIFLIFANCFIAYYYRASYAPLLRATPAA